MKRSSRLVAVLAVAAALGVSVAAQGGQAGQAAPGAQAPQGGQGGRAGGRGRGGFNLPPLLMETDAFPDGGIVPQKYAGRGGVQPGFKFSGAPEGTVSYAIIFHDIDVALQQGTNDVLHWLAWNIPASANGIPEGKLPEGSVQGNNITGQPNYMGPGAPAGPRYHHYVFELYALNANLDLPPTASRDDLLKAMQGKIVAKSAYVGRFRGTPQ
jgi:Raf kinase inhibitor-like YbhB/YbcL family protein